MKCAHKSHWTAVILLAAIPLVLLGFSRTSAAEAFRALRIVKQQKEEEEDPPTRKVSPASLQQAEEEEEEDPPTRKVAPSSRVFRVNRSNHNDNTGTTRRDHRRKVRPLSTNYTENDEKGSTRRDHRRKVRRKAGSNGAGNALRRGTSRQAGGRGANRGGGQANNFLPPSRADVVVDTDRELAPPPPSQPAAPRNLRVTDVTRNSLEVRWDYQSNGHAADRFWVRYTFPVSGTTAKAKSEYVGPQTRRAYLTDEVEPGVQYKIKVAALSDSAKSPWSNERRVTTPGGSGGSGSPEEETSDMSLIAQDVPSGPRLYTGQFPRLTSRRDG